MRYPKLKAPEKRRVLIDRFRGCEHLPEPGAGAFYDMRNLTGVGGALLRTRGRRTETARLEGCPADRVLAVGGRGAAVILDDGGTLWSGGQALPRLLDGVVSLTARDWQGRSVTVADRDAVLRALARPGVYRYCYQAAYGRWSPLDGGGVLAGSVLEAPELLDGQIVELDYGYTLHRPGLRRLVFLGGWVCVFPDGKFVNTVRLRGGYTLREGEDYGDLAQENLCDQGGTCFTPCREDGSLPEDPTEACAWVKCQAPGIAKGLRAGDCVELFAHFDSNQGGEAAVEALWNGSAILAGAFHDPGAGDREEGREDYLILPGSLPQSYEIELTWHDRGYLSVSRPVPEMDFVVEAGNRLWGCRCDGGVNELYGSKLGDFRNWNVFAGLSTDSYRVARGHEGPYTGAAVLGGCPLFFRADCLEKIYPSAGGDHGVVSVSLEGIAPGCAESAVVIRDRLYYKSLTGVCCYNGTLPVRISRALGELPCVSAAAGALGSRYYLSVTDPAGQSALCVFDTDAGLWYKEDELAFPAAYGTGDKLFLLERVGGALLQAEGAADSRGVDWWAETGELGPRLGTRRYVSRVQIAARLEPGAALRVCLSYDGGPWLRQGELTGNRLRTLTLSVPARRCSRLRLRLEGSGGMELRSLSWLTEAGSDV